MVSRSYPSRAYENRVLRGGWRKLHNEELYQIFVDWKEETVWNA
jgi:hypothetical protein